MKTLPDTVKKMTLAQIEKKYQSDFVKMEKIINELIEQSSTPEEAQKKVNEVVNGKIYAKIQKRNYDMLTVLAQLSFDEYLQLQINNNEKLGVFLKSMFTKIIDKFIDDMEN